MTVFFVDDDVNMLDLFQIKFEPEVDAGLLDVVCYSSGDDAFDDIVDGAFLSVDVIITDLNMPGMSGEDFVGEVKALYPEVKVYMISGMDDREIIESVIYLGAQGYFTKPLDFKIIKDLILKTDDPEVYPPSTPRGRKPA